jgi:hypothetical protein
LAPQAKISCEGYEVPGSSSALALSNTGHRANDVDGPVTQSVISLHGPHVFLPSRHRLAGPELVSVLGLVTQSRGRRVAEMPNCPLTVKGGGTDQSSRAPPQASPTMGGLGTAANLPNFVCGRFAFFWADDGSTSCQKVLRIL